MSSLSPGFVQASGGEPDLMGVCENDPDRVTLRNIVYSLWALNKSGGGGAGAGDSTGGGAQPNCYLVRVIFTFNLYSTCTT